ncbi:MAG: alpha/beta fold hydrolase [Candidatus Nealsonbacteria bacterium]
MEEKIVLINSLKTNFKVAGQGPAILILHGWGGSSFSWLKVQKLLTAKSYKVICPDFPGFGKSKTPKEPWSITDYVRWTVDFMKSQKLDRFFLLGHSFGGRVAIKFAVEFPEKVKALILCDTAGIKREPNLKTKIVFLLSKVGNMIFAPKFLVRFKDKARNLFYIFLRHKDYVKANGIMKETMKKVLDEDLLSYLSNIKIKTLIVWGRKDKIVPLEDAYFFKEKINNSQLEILPEIGHSPHLEVPEKLVNIISNFLSPV